MVCIYYGGFPDETVVGEETNPAGWGWGLIAKYRLTDKLAEAR